MVAKRILVIGKVQGAGFRSYVSSRAQELRIRGRVTNQADGSVEILAEHEDPAKIKVFSNLLWSGPGRVDDVSQEPAEPQGHSAFVVAYSQDQPF
jgi:acylphosphatase